MHFSTATCSATDKNRVWAQKVSETYFPLSAECRNNSEFQGGLSSWSLGLLGLSEMACDGVHYHRRRSHFANERDSSLLITIPQAGEVHFRQAAREARCGPGGFLVERGDMPYEFWHPRRNRLWVLKVPTASVRSRLGATDRLGALTFDGTTGLGAYFTATVRNAIAFADDMGEAGREMAGQHLLDLLCLAMRSDERILDSQSSTIRAAHLQRAEQVIRDNLANPRLSSQMVAEASSICFFVKPRWRKRSNDGSASFAAGMPRVLVRNPSPSVHWFITKRMSKAEGSAFSMASISRFPKP